LLKYRTIDNAGQIKQCVDLLIQYSIENSDTYPSHAHSFDCQCGHQTSQTKNRVLKAVR
jgi:hypothetical protein